MENLLAARTSPGADSENADGAFFGVIAILAEALRSFIEAQAFAVFPRRSNQTRERTIWRWNGA